MANPIQATPVLRGEDARRLLDELKQIAPPEEQERRKKEAMQYLAQVTRK